jgi:hypothetical protein
MEFKKLYDAMEEPKAKLEDLEIDVINRLKKGAKVEPGSIQVILDVNERRNPPWKKLVEKFKGKAFVVKTIQETEPTLIEKLVIKNILQKEVKG